MNRILPSAIIKKYIDGTASEEEEKQLMDWYESFSGEEDPISGLSPNEQNLLKRKMFNKIAARTELVRAGTSVRRVLSIAAGIAAVFLITALFVIKGNKTGNQINATRISKDTLFENKSNEIVRHVFPDRSEAWLQPKATLRYTKLFNGKFREVVLDGEAFFDVQPDRTKPFLVRSGKILTRVVGTSFKVRTSKKNDEAEVSVLSGKVMVSLPHPRDEKDLKEVVLLPNESVRYSKSVSQLTKNTVQAQDLSIWRKSSLNFDNTAVRDVISALNARFDVDISVKDPDINSYLLDADFNQVNLPSILNMMQASLDINYHIQGSRIVLEKDKTSH